MNKYRWCTPSQCWAIHSGMLSYMARRQSWVWIYSVTGLLWKTCLPQCDEERWAISLSRNVGLKHGSERSMWCFWITVLVCCIYDMCCYVSKKTKPIKKQVPLMVTPGRKICCLEIDLTHTMSVKSILITKISHVASNYLENSSAGLASKLCCQLSLTLTFLLGFQRDQESTN